MNIFQKIRKNGIKPYIKALPAKLVDIYDSCLDKSVCGCSLTETLPTKYQELGATRSQPSHWLVLKELFSKSKFKTDDKIIDIGCGQGRVIAFLIKSKFPGKIHGIELDPDIADLCRAWSKKYENVSIITGNAFEHNFNDYTVLFMGRPFEFEQFKAFIAKLENELNHPITLYHNWGHADSNYLCDREGWNLIKSKTYLKKFGLPLAYSPQKYSVLSYTPKNQ